MDPFTQRMLERAKSRKEKLDNQKIILNQRSPLQEKVNVNERMSDCNETTDNRDKGEQKQLITATRKSKLQKLAQFYSGNNENTFLDDVECDEEEKIPCDIVKKTPCKLGRLGELANKIKQWEDDEQPKKHRSNLEDNSKNSKGSKGTTKEKRTIWDNSMVEKLCSQGFVRSESQAKLSYDFERKTKEPKDAKNLKNDPMLEQKTSRREMSAQSTVGNRNEVLKKAAFFELTTKESPNKSSKDPAELSLAERKALFERNKGEVVLPKYSCYPERKIVQTEEKEMKREQRGEVVAFPSREVKRLFEDTKVRDCLPSRESAPGVEEFSVKEGNEVLKENGLIPNPPPMPTPQGDIEVTSNLLGRDENTSEAFSPKSGRLYPSLSSLDVTKECETSLSQMDSFNESKNSNLCLNMTLSELLELNKNNPTTPPSDQSFSQSKECQVLNKMDRLLEDALNDLSSGTEEDADDVVPSPPKMKKSSSFEYKSGHGNANPLLHTVSFYRKQQQKSCSSAKDVEEEMNFKPENRKEEEGNDDESVLVQNKIQILIAEVNKQQTIISQASQALNLCLSTVEFSGSGEQVEGERLLLSASHKRQACLNEIQRLKVENTLLSQGRSSFLTEKGDVKLTNISIKLKRDALRSIAAAENLQYFVCLIRSDEQVLATPAVSATKENLKDMALQFPGQIKLENLLSDFKITVEVYNLELGKELLPHDVKYHIVNKKEKKLLTPIKSKKTESKLIKPNIQSPAGPNAVRTSNFQMCGYIVFSLRELNRTQWILNKVPYVSPVEGTISMTIESQLRLNDEFRGFLTMFDDISGFGAWHRRWCLLSSYFISYWKYPDDETKKIPIGTIDLRSVVTEDVGLVSRDICARLNTFLLETTRPRLSEDVNSLVVSVKDDVTTIRHLLSADSKLEMTTWCKKLNTALALLRSWKCNMQ